MKGGNMVNTNKLRGAIAEKHEYLILTLDNGETSTFRFSHVEILPKFVTELRDLIDARQIRDMKRGVNY